MRGAPQNPHWRLAGKQGDPIVGALLELSRLTFELKRTTFVSWC
jgi:hypothetical protein